MRVCIMRVCHDTVTLSSSLQEEVKFPSRLGDIARTVLTGLLIKDPVKRLGGGPKDVEDVKSHPFFASLNWQVSSDSHVTCM